MSFHVSQEFRPSNTLRKHDLYQFILIAHSRSSFAVLRDNTHSKTM